MVLNPFRSPSRFTSQASHDNLPNLFRVSGNSKLCRFQHFTEHIEMQRKFNHQFCQQIGIETKTVHFHHVFIKPEEEKQVPYQAKETYVQNFRFVEQLTNFCVTVEDKDPSVLWCARTDVFLSQWFFQILQTPDRWCFQAMRNRF